MKYNVVFSFTEMHVPRGLGLCFQGMQGDVEILAERPLSLQDPEQVEALCELIAADLCRQGHNVIRNMLKIESLTPLN